MDANARMGKRRLSRRSAVAASLIVAVLAISSWGDTRSGSSSTVDMVSVIVRTLPGSPQAAERAVEREGGITVRRIGIIGGLVAEVPRASLDRLSAESGILAVTRNGRVQLAAATNGYDAGTDPYSLYTIAQKVTGASSYWAKGFTGKGVDVALIDSGVANVQGLNDAGKVVYGPDFSVESQAPNLRNKDAFGHGTHMAGIIAGRDSATAVKAGNTSRFLGIAPDARVVSVKVADAQGWTDVSQVIAGIDWVVNHTRSDGLNIRVLNLSFGSYGLQSYLLDPLSYAAEVAWRKGLVVVVSAGNRGGESIGMTNPAIDPYVIAVGGYTDPGGLYGTSDATIPSWSSRGDGVRNPDVVAPGTSVASLRVPASDIDQLFPSARVGGRFFRGSGSSQATAVVSGAAALILQQRPTISPDQIKALLRQSATKIPSATVAAQGAGALDLKVALGKTTPSALLTKQLFVPATGLGSLEAARGSLRIVDGTVALTGEQDLFGVGWDAVAWTDQFLRGVTWVGGVWRTVDWAGATWTANDFAGRTWSGRTWSDNTWDGRTWSGRSWSGRSWSGRSWSGRSWSDEGWSARSWD
ncbi:MAG: S8 family serine peptidase [Actinomycetota bacterium]